MESNAMKEKRRHSEKRDAIWRAVYETEAHPSAEQVYETVRRQYPEISLGTVYRNLAQFRADGAIKSVGVVNGQERFDVRVEPHPHFICRVCGRVMDLHRLPQSGSQAALVMEHYPVSVEYQETVFHGVCHACRQASQSQKH